MHSLFWALLTLFLVATFVRLDWVYYLVYVIGGVWLFSHWWIGRSLRQLSVQRRLDAYAFRGETLPCAIEVANRSRLPLPWLRLQDRVPLALQDRERYQQVVALGGRDSHTFRYSLACKQRGYHKLGPMRLETGDLFGFTSQRWEESGTAFVTVYPEIVPLQRLGLPSRMPFGPLPTSQRLVLDPSKAAGVRSYVSGDGLRHIHWKATAREDTLQVKKFQPALALNVMIALNLHTDDYPIRSAVGSSEWAISIAASLASYVAGERQPVGLLASGLDPVSEQSFTVLPPRTGQGGLMNLLGVLARVQMHDRCAPLKEWLPTQLARLEWGTTLLLVTPRIDDEVLWTLNSAQRRGTRVLVLLCVAPSDGASLRRRAGQMKVSVHIASWERDLHALQEEQIRVPTP